MGQQRLETRSVNVKRDGCAIGKPYERLPAAAVGVYSHVGMANADGYIPSIALTEMMGESQAVRMTKYAENLMLLLKGFKFEAQDVPSYLEFLKKAGWACVEIKKGRQNSISLNIHDCSIAGTVHKSLNLSGYSGEICPIAMAFMVLKAKELGWRPGKNLFDYIRFSCDRTYMTETGSRTEFQLLRLKVA